MRIEGNSGYVGIGTTSPARTLDIVGNMQISSSTAIGSTTSSLHVEGSGSEVFAVDGTLGRMFTVSDEMSGSIFSANTISGTPVIEATSDHHVFLNPFGNGRVGIGTSNFGGDLGASSALHTHMLQVTGEFGKADHTGGVVLFQNTHDSAAAGDEIVRIQFSGDGDATGAHFVNFYDQAGDIGRINVNSSSTTAYATTSDYRLKENETLILDGLSRVNLLKPYKFNFKVAPDVTQDGFFAHEVAEVVPIAVSGEKDAVDENGNIIKQYMDMNFLIPILTSAVQQLTSEVKSLRAAITGSTDLNQLKATVSGSTFV